MNACRVHVSGVVQGVGFRPWVWRAANSLGLHGWVRNSSSGVEILFEGPSDRIDSMLRLFREGGPELARIDSLAVESCDPAGCTGFEIRDSASALGEYLPVSPDIATCEACLREIRDPSARRYRYPFTNCTDCGPRFTIISDIPYDRGTTTMAVFRMCEHCREEYENPADRRFHAQPIACPDCGPRLRLECHGEVLCRDDHAMLGARQRLAAGQILAVKGLGGFHLACDASNELAVARLRAVKRREARPFALMCASVETVRMHASVSLEQERLLASRERPVVLLPRRSDSKISAEVAPRRDHLGFMLPYTPQHHLLMEAADGFPGVLVMTSANLSDEPIAYEDDDARQRLTPMVDAFLTHERPIRMRVDDSVVSELNGRSYLFRRSRGYAPLPVRLPFAGPSVLAAGAEMKNAFCLTRDDRAFLSHHIGEMGCHETLRSFEDGIDHFGRLFRIEPKLVAHDLHPDYHATRVALRRAARGGLPAVGVQHHHAHIASCMADNGLTQGRRVIGVCFDGAGFGPDGAIWGGEFLVCGYGGYERVSHLRYVPLPGGDAAAKKPYRAALSYLRQAHLDWSAELPPVLAAGEEEVQIIAQQLHAGVNSPPTSSMGRLFDAFASLIGACHRNFYEAQAAAELETLANAAGAGDGEYPFEIAEHDIDAAPVIRRAVEDLRLGVSPVVMAHRFHTGVARMVVSQCCGMRERSGIGEVALSGGVWQNMLLLQLSMAMLQKQGFEVLVHREVPANDGGIALGQASVAIARSLSGAAIG